MPVCGLTVLAPVLVLVLGMCCPASVTVNADLATFSGASTSMKAAEGLVAVPPGRELGRPGSAVAGPAPGRALGRNPSRRQVVVEKRDEEESRREAREERSQMLLACDYGDIGSSDEEG